MPLGIDTHVFHRDPTKNYRVADHASGVYIWDTDGKRYLDGSSGALVVNIGHGSKEVQAAIEAQLSTLSFAHTSQFTSSAQEELGRRLWEVAPTGLGHSYFVSSGSEANEAALKLARQYFLKKGSPEKWKVVSRKPSYHGATLGALAMTGHVARRAPHLPQLATFPHIDAPYCHRCPLHLQYPSCEVACALELETKILREGPDTVAAFIAEPVIGASGGAIVPPADYYKTVRAICDRYDVLFIADEVMTGLGRTGEMFGMTHWNVIPDLLVLGKGLGSGYAPIAAVLVKDDIYEVFQTGAPFIDGHTYAGHPLSCAVGAAVLEVVVREELPARSASMGQLLIGGLRELRSHHPAINDVRGLGLMTALELADPSTGSPFSPDRRAAQSLTAAAFEEGLIVYPGTGQADGTQGDVIMVAPPLIVSQGEIEELIEKLDRALTRLESRHPGN